MAPEYDDILDSLFHGCAWAAYLDQAAEERGWPSREGTRRRAFDYYEHALREKNAAKRPAPPAIPAASAALSRSASSGLLPLR